ncbi:MAG: mechanosensitive ion channel family protein [Gammaproteobacteria bacterium]|nr:mechanosensitive ion channel family protein [Gammaproteobacteria bacterium]
MDWLPEAWRPMWDMLANYPILGALGLIAIAYVLALLTRVIFVFVLEHLATRSKSEMDNIVLQNLRRPVFTTTFALGLVMAVQISALSFGASVLINVLTSAIVVSWMLAGLRLSSDVLSGLSANPKFNLVEPRTIPLFDLVIKLGILLFSSYGLLMIWGINPVGWLASAGIVGIAVGFAAKDTLANLFSGLFILADSPYQIGDYINLDSGERGMVTAIGMRSTRLLTRADVEITVPNAVIANAKITNESGGPYKKMRIRLPVGAAYGSDVDVVCDILQRTGEGHTETCGLPAPRVRMRGFGASSLDFELLAWIEQPADRGRISHELYIAIYKAFADQGIEIPFTKQDLYIKEMPK